MNNKKIALLVFLILTAMLFGCTLSSGEDTPTPNNQTKAALTVESHLAQNSGGQSSPQQLNTDTPGGQPPPPQQPTYTQPPTYTPFPTFTPLPQPTATSSIPCDSAKFVSETIPDGTKFTPGETFTKSWTIKNKGTCTWTSGYDWIFASGDAMGGPASTQLTSGTVAPNGTVTISFDLTAPASPGTYRGTFKVRNQHGEVFTDNGFWVEIKVVEDTSFTIQFDNIHDCGFYWVVVAKVKNTGTKNLESAEIELINVTTSTTINGPWTSDTPFFDDPNACIETVHDMEPGDFFYIGAGVAAEPTSGHKLKFIVTLCTQNGNAGECVTETIKFFVP